MSKDTVKHASGDVTLTNAKFLCTSCKKLKPASQVGLRRMKDGKIRNQAQCKSCRSQ